ncbi:probable E3 ubiquitin-protein ligase XERICO [Abrus precatorius]|uniref:Probable E3 ubiquitin-protein ligase XERICO n=1 Tax=Abrus precatorius TaxID=3816 RepID=A0A8B8M8V2_ABRPR|nr:probable E3 ubiquitin-protein ligase XERICO [Abrus precatorius]
MTALSELLYQLYSKTIVLLTYILIELILIIRYLKSDTNSISTTQYLNFIEENNPTIRYTRRLKVDHLDCRVCLSEFEEGENVRNLNCKHTFHKDCLDQWLKQYCATCPLCRNKVLPDHVVEKYHLLQNQLEYDANDDQLIFLLSALRGGSTLHRYL